MLAFSGAIATRSPLLLSYLHAKRGVARGGQGMACDGFAMAMRRMLAGCTHPDPCAREHTHYSGLVPLLEIGPKVELREVARHIAAPDHDVPFTMDFQPPSQPGRGALLPISQLHGRHCRSADHLHTCTLMQRVARERTLPRRAAEVAGAAPARSCCNRSDGVNRWRMVPSKRCAMGMKVFTGMRTHRCKCTHSQHVH